MCSCDVVGLTQQFICPCQKVPKDALKKLVIQMEKQKLVYEETAIVALQKATQEKAKAASRAATLEVDAQSSQRHISKWVLQCHF